jgi:hypothetical protein
VVDEAIARLNQSGGAEAVSDQKQTITLGFLTVVQHELHGYFGGYLVLNANGRPVEFHCTAPVKPNRAQEILYGPTLEPYLYGEQIGQTLIAKSKTTPLAVCTDLAGVLAAREFVSTPIALVEAQRDGAPAENDASKKTWRVDAPHRPALVRFEFGHYRLGVSNRHSDDQQKIVDRLAAMVDYLELAETFDRIRGAIEEAQRATR